MADKVLDFNLRLNTTQADRALSTFASRMKHNTKMINEGFKVAFEPLAALGVGFGVYEAIKKTGEFEDSIRRIGIDANMTTAEMMQLKDRVLDVAMATGAAPEQITEMGKALATTTKDSAFMNSELGYMSKLMQATGASGESLGEAMGTLHEMTGLSGKDFENFFGTLYSAGQKKGMLSLKEILPSIEQLTKTAKALYGPNATAKQIGDVITAGMFTHSPEAIERGLKMMVSNRKTKSALVAMGFNLAKGFPSIGDIIERATEMSPNRTVRLAYLSGIFGKSTSAMAKLIDESEEYKRITDSTHPEEVFTAANTQARSFSSAINTLNTVFLKFADKALSPAINEFAEQLKSISPEDIAALGKVFEELGKGIGFTVKGLLEIPGAMKEAWGWIKLANEMNPNAGGGRVMNVNGILEQVGSKTAVEAELSALNTKKNAGWLMSDKEDKRMKELNTIDSLYNVPQVTNHVYVDSTKIPIAKTVTHVNKTGKQLQPVNP